MTNTEVRSYLEFKNITCENVTEEEIVILREILKDKIKEANLYDGTMKLSKLLKKQFKFITVNTNEWKQRECISFNQDGFIGIAGWASTENSKPFVESLIQWSNTIRKK